MLIHCIFSFSVPKYFIVLYNEVRLFFFYSTKCQFEGSQINLNEKDNKYYGILASYAFLIYCHNKLWYTMQITLL